MPLRTTALLVLVLALLTACGGGNDAQEEFAEDGAADAELEEDTFGAGPHGPSASDSIPMQITLRLGESSAGGPSGTFSVSGRGSACRHNPNASVGEVVPEWVVLYADEHQPEIQHLHLQVGKTTEGSTEHMQLLFMHAERPAEMHQINTWAGGPQAGRGTARVRREGGGVRIEMQGETNVRRPIEVSVLCERLGEV